MSTQNTEFIRVLLFINYCILFPFENCKPTFAPPYTRISVGGSYEAIGVCSTGRGAEHCMFFPLSL